jgi:heme exporter protein D
MLAAPVLAQTEFSLPDAGGGEIIVWLILAAGIVGLFLLINRTRKRSFKDYMSRAEREARMKADDPDMKQEE